MVDASRTHEAPLDQVPVMPHWSIEIPTPEILATLTGNGAVDTGSDSLDLPFEEWDQERGEAESGSND
jgi:hypothetical protein